MMRNYMCSREFISGSKNVFYRFESTCRSNKNDLSSINISYSRASRTLNIECKNRKEEIVVRLKYFCVKDDILSYIDDIFNENPFKCKTSIKETIDCSECGCGELPICACELFDYEDKTTGPSGCDLGDTLIVSGCEFDYEKRKFSMRIIGISNKYGPFDREFDITNITIEHRPGSVETYYKFRGPKLTWARMRSNSCDKDIVVAGFPGIRDDLFRLSVCEFEKLTNVLRSIENIVKNFNRTIREV